MSKPKYYGRDIGADGPWVTLCLSQEEFNRELKELNVKEKANWMASPTANATTHFIESSNGVPVAVVTLGDCGKIDAVQVACVLVHEAVHVWQWHCQRIGEKAPGMEIEAYGIQNISQKLMTEYARRCVESPKTGRNSRGRNGRN